jgi:hypothetical protein
VTADIGICDTLVLAQLMAENAELRGDAVSEIRAELERLWLEFAFAQEEEL